MNPQIISLCMRDAEQSRWFCATTHMEKIIGFWENNMCPFFKKKREETSHMIHFIQRYLVNTFTVVIAN